MIQSKALRRTRRMMRKLRRGASGVAMLEFALSMPFFLSAGVWGIETANFAVINMKVGQMAVHIADNASRIGDTSMLENRAIYEADINDLLVGANELGGVRLNFFEHGRAIISSLELYDEADHCIDGTCPATAATEDQQFIHWQRCLGRKTATSSYGDAGDVMPNGIGPAGREVMALPGEATIFVELFYDYQPLVSNMFIQDTTIHSIGSFTVRSDRDLTQVYQRDESAPDPISSCSNFDNPYGAPAVGGGTGGSSGSSGGGSGGGGGGGGASSSGGGGGSSSSTGGGSSSSSSSTGGSSSSSTGGSSSSSSSSSSTGGSSSSTGGGSTTSTTTGGSTTTTGGSSSTTSTTSGGGSTGGRGGGRGGGSSGATLGYSATG